MAATTGVVGARELAAQLTAGAAKVDVLMAVVVKKSAEDLVALIQMRAKGRPGPNAPTGDYRGSWSPPEPVMAGAGTYAMSVGTDRAQAARLEFGFGGTEAVNTDGIDSLGRHYHQQPLPHWGPANDEMEPLFYAAMAKVSDMALPW